MAHHAGSNRRRCPCHGRRPVWTGASVSKLRSHSADNPTPAGATNEQQEPRSAETSWLPRSGEHRARGHTSCKHLERSKRESRHLPSWLPDLSRRGDVPADPWRCPNSKGAAALGRRCPGAWAVARSAEAGRAGWSTICPRREGAMSSAQFSCCSTPVADARRQRWLAITPGARLGTRGWSIRRIRRQSTRSSP